LLKKNYIQIFFFIVITIIVFAHNNSVSLWDQDEAAYAGFAKNMIESENWLIPGFTWSDIHRKPPMHFWNIAISYHLFGINEFSVRFPSSLFIILTYLIIFFWGGKLFGKEVSFLGVIVLSTSFLVPSLAKISVTDATLLFYSTVCSLAVLQIIQRKNIGATIIFWVAFSLALLTKGPPIIIFSSVFVAILFLFHPKRKNLLSLMPWFFLPLSFAPLFVWGYLTTLTDGGDLINWMIDWYILKRVSGSVLGQTGPPGTHLLLLVLFFIPYLMFLPKAFWSGVRGIVKDKNENLLLGTWFIAGWLIYEFSPSKLPAYTIVAHVPLAILIGKTILNYIKTDTRPNKFLVIVHSSFFSILLLGLPVASYLMKFPESIIWTFAIVNGIILAGMAATFLFLKSKQFIHSLLGINLLFQFVLWVILLPQIDGLKDGTKKVSSYITNNAIKESTIVIGNNNGSPPSLPFYISLNFEKLEEEQNFDLLLSKYRSRQPYVFILNHQQKEKFTSTYPQINYKEINSFFVDRKGKPFYYIVMNDVSKKQNVIE
jgi:4-amino-4-deoxy-L-arabinose transferase-like glycosyltransferase